MSQYWLLFLLGLGAGAVYAILSLGLVLEYRSSGIVNFAHGAVAMFIAYVFTELRSTGDLVLPVVGIPDRISLADGGLALAPAMLIALIYSAALGAAIYWLIFGRLRHAPAAAGIVASVGLMILLQSLAPLKFGTAARAAGPVLPDEALEVWGVLVPRDRLWLAVVAVALTVALWVVYRFTRFGKATRAAAENERAAELTGFATGRLALANWIVATILAGIAGMLISPISSLDPGLYTLFIVPALAAALMGGFRSFPVATITALAIGAFQSMVPQAQLDIAWLPDFGVREALPFLVIVIALMFRGRSLPARDWVLANRLPRVGRPERIVPWLIVGLGAGLALLAVTDGIYRAAVIHSMVGATIALSFVVVTGYAGQLSLAQVAFAGVGGFALSRAAEDWGLPFPLSVLIAAVVAALVGVIVGLPALRIRGTQLAVVTLALAVVVDEMIFKDPGITGGIGGADIPTLRFLGMDLDINGRAVSDYPRLAFGIVALIVLALLAVLVANLRRSLVGRRMLAVRANERAAAAAGVGVASTKLAAFSIAAAIAAVAGCFAGYEQGVVSVESFGVFVSLAYLAAVAIGGIARIGGALFAGLIVTGGLFPLILDDGLGAGRFELVLIGVLVILSSVYNPDGVAARIADRVAARRPPRIPAPASVVTEPPAPRHRTIEGPALVVEALSVRYRGLQAVDGVSLELQPGTIVGLIGPNGAGKTSVVDAVTGFTAASGRVALDGVDVGGWSTHRRSRHGISRTFQSLELFEDLTVRENVEVASAHPGLVALTTDVLLPRRRRDDRVDWALGFCGLGRFAERVVADLPYGRRKMVGLARALAAAPHVLLLDEPAAGLDTEESRALGEHLRELPRLGIAVLLVDHDIDLVLAVSDHLAVMDHGRLIAAGSPETILTNPDVVDAYLGTDRSRRPKGSAPPEVLV